MDIVPEKQNIDMVFSNTIYYIDFYQREYKWSEEPVKRLLDDIFFKFNQEYESNISLDPGKDTVNSKYSWYYLNTYVTNEVNGKAYVVDGQQRLTTLTLVLIKFLHMTQKILPVPKISKWIEAKIVGYSGEDLSFWMNHENSRQVLEDIFENNIENIDLNSVESITSINLVKNYKEISKYLDRELNTEHKLFTFIYYFLCRVVMINLDVQQTEVPMVFEVINDRGVRLKPYEILKGKLLGQIDKDELEKQDLNGLWESHVNKINDFFEDEIDNFFRYYLKAKFANNRKEGSLFDGDYHRQMFVNSINDKLKLNHNPIEVKLFLKNTFSYYTTLYYKILSKYKEYDSNYPSVICNRLNEMDSQFMLILSACKINDPCEEEKIEKVAFEIDRLFSLLQLQSSYDSNSFYEILHRISEEIRNGELNNYRDIFDKYLIQELANKRNNDVTMPFQYVFFKNTGINLNMRFKRYFFARVEMFLSYNLNQRMKHGIEELVTKTGTKTGFHIEHILAYNDVNVRLFKDEDEFENERNRLGGILLLKGKDNISSNNEAYEDKLKSYANTLYWNETLREDTYKSKLDMEELKIRYNLNLVPYNHFGPEELENRQRLLFEISKIIWDAKK